MQHVVKNRLLPPAMACDPLKNQTTFDISLFEKKKQRISFKNSNAKRINKQIIVGKHICLGGSCRTVTTSPLSKNTSWKEIPANKKNRHFKIQKQKYIPSDGVGKQFPRRNHTPHILQISQRQSADSPHIRRCRHCIAPIPRRVSNQLKAWQIYELTCGPLNSNSGGGKPEHPTHPLSLWLSSQQRQHKKLRKY